MRFKSRKIAGYRAYAVTGVDTGLLRHRLPRCQHVRTARVCRRAPRSVENERYFMSGFKVFQSRHSRTRTELRRSRRSTSPCRASCGTTSPPSPTRVPYLFHPLKGEPKNLDRSAAPITLDVRTEPLFSERHDVFFNRGVASSQAYARRFGNDPDRRPDPVERKQAFGWLSRDLDDALFEFIDQAEDRATRCSGASTSSATSRPRPRLKAAIDRGVDVRLIVDAQAERLTDKHGKFHGRSRARTTCATLAAGELPRQRDRALREARRSASRTTSSWCCSAAGATPAEVWTGSTNLSLGGIHGQTNVGHWVRNAAVAAAFRNYWELVPGRSGPAKGDTRRRRTPSASSTAKRSWHSPPLPARWQDVAKGGTTVFSPRSGTPGARHVRRHGGRGRQGRLHHARVRHQHSASRTGSPTTPRAATSSSSCSRSGT